MKELVLVEKGKDKGTKKPLSLKSIKKCHSYVASVSFKIAFVIVKGKLRTKKEKDK